MLRGAGYGKTLGGHQVCDVVLSHVSFAYEYDQTVLHDISLTVSSGDFLAVVGPNGAGKSTILKIMAGLMLPQTGSVKIAGCKVETARKRGMIGYVPQNYGKNALGFPATVAEVVKLGLVTGENRKQPTSGAAHHIVNHMLELVGGSELRQRRIGELSGGQQQRVMVARALAGNPELLLLDEPTSGVDFAASAKIYELLGELNRNLGITVIMVSHDIDKTTQWAQKVACINRGLCFYGGSKEFQETHVQARHLWYYTG